MVTLFYKTLTDNKKEFYSTRPSVNEALEYLKGSNWPTDRYYEVSIEEETSGRVLLNWIHPSDIISQFPTVYPSTQHLNETDQMAAKTAFEYTVILHALPSKDNAGNDTTPDSKIIIGPTTVVAVDANHVTRIASRGIDSKISDSDLGRVEIKVRNL